MTSSPLRPLAAWQINHTPLQVPASYLARVAHIGDPRRQTYAAMTGFVDDAVGNVTAALKANRGMWRRTIFVTLSDNGGPDSSANNYPLAGFKFSDMEGGIRVVASVSGGFLPAARAGVTVSEFVHVSDLFATLLAVAGLPAAATAAEAAAGLPGVDGVDAWPLIAGSNSTPPREEFPLSVPPCEDGSGGGYVRGRWKLLLGVQRNGALRTGPVYPNSSTPNVTTAAAAAAAKRRQGELGGEAPGKGGLSHDLDCGYGGCLFDIRADPSEERDVAAANPLAVAELKAALAAHAKTYYQTPLFPLACNDTRLQAVLKSGRWQPFMD